MFTITAKSADGSRIVWTIDIWILKAHSQEWKTTKLEKHI